MTATLKRVVADGQVSVTVVGDVKKGTPSRMRPDVMSAVRALGSSTIATTSGFTDATSA